MMNTIYPCLWFDNQAEQAVRFYTTIFKNSSVEETTYYGDAGPGPKGSVLVITFNLMDQYFMALNGGPEYKHTPAISLVVECENQEEVDYYWEKLSQGGEKGPCGWLTDQFGISWQVVPRILAVWMGDKNEKKAVNVTRAMLQMGKLDIQELKAAYEKG